MCGPDATKVGTDFGVSMAAFMNSTSGKVAVAVPQERLFIFNYNQDMQHCVDSAVA